MPLWHSLPWNCIFYMILLIETPLNSVNPLCGRITSPDRTSKTFHAKRAPDLLGPSTYESVLAFPSSKAYVWLCKQPGRLYKLRLRRHPFATNLYMPHVLLMRLFLPSMRRTIPIISFARWDSFSHSWDFFLYNFLTSRPTKFPKPLA